MNATERRSIERIIKGRFELLASELEDLAGEYRSQVNKDIEAQFKKELEAAGKAEDELRALAAKLNDQARAAIDKLRAKGVEPSHRYYGNGTAKVFELKDHIEWEPIGMAKAKADALNDIAKRLTRAKNALRREELDLLEKLHRTSIESGDAEDFLSELPTAEDIMLKASEAKSLTA